MLWLLVGLVPACRLPVVAEAAEHASQKPRRVEWQPKDIGGGWLCYPGVPEGSSYWDEGTWTEEHSTSLHIDSDRKAWVGTSYGHYSPWSMVSGASRRICLKCV